MILDLAMLWEPDTEEIEGVHNILNHIVHLSPGVSWELLSSRLTCKKTIVRELHDPSDLKMFLDDCEDMYDAAMDLLKKDAANSHDNLESRFSNVEYEACYLDATKDKTKREYGDRQRHIANVICRMKAHFEESGCVFDTGVNFALHISEKGTDGVEDVVWFIVHKYRYDWWCVRAHLFGHADHPLGTCRLDIPLVPRPLRYIIGENIEVMEKSGASFACTYGVVHTRWDLMSLAEASIHDFGHVGILSDMLQAIRKRKRRTQDPSDRDIAVEAEVVEDMIRGWSLVDDHIELLTGDDNEGFENSIEDMSEIERPAMGERPDSVPQAIWQDQLQDLAEAEPTMPFDEMEAAASILIGTHGEHVGMAEATDSTGGGMTAEERQVFLVAWAKSVCDMLSAILMMMPPSLSDPKNKSLSLVLIFEGGSNILRWIFWDNIEELRGRLTTLDGHNRVIYQPPATSRNFDGEMHAQRMHILIPDADTGMFRGSAADRTSIAPWALKVYNLFEVALSDEFTAFDTCKLCGNHLMDGDPLPAHCPLCDMHAHSACAEAVRVPELFRALGELRDDAREMLQRGAVSKPIKDNFKRLCRCCESVVLEVLAEL